MTSLVVESVVQVMNHDSNLVPLTALVLSLPTSSSEF